MITDLNGATLAFDRTDNHLVILDQTLLPKEVKLLHLSVPDEIFEAISVLRVRGAPAIGVAAAIAMAVCAKNIKMQDKQEYFTRLESIKEYLASSRPTAQNLFWALERMMATARQVEYLSISQINERLADEAELVLNEDIAVCRRIGGHGAMLLGDGACVLTHCNAGRLAAVKYGTALAPVYVAAEQGKKIHVYVDETRPLLQGARLTAYELADAGIKTTVICDNMAGSLMAAGKVDAVITGADRIAKNFDAANKIGTLQLAVMAKHFGVPFYIAAPKSTFDPDCASGNDIVIEMRSGSEIAGVWRESAAVPPDFDYNPAFDVTPAALISAIITEEGVHYLHE
ncbi:MAG: S-methyl-5-thioribose-1-phosphate isomerase [Oscillospiraceae bacterium]|jgi:methylthioribose-1-phosphate isomerase|nr:S-methyl-5-thioribose-1-phosphate isomerase [Oscillospiraceae bacterium]